MNDRLPGLAVIFTAMRIPVTRLVLVAALTSVMPLAVLPAVAADPDAINPAPAPQDWQGLAKLRIGAASGRR